MWLESQKVNLNLKREIEELKEGKQMGKVAFRTFISPLAHSLKYSRNSISMTLSTNIERKN
jgi:hypothetical protein